MIQTDKETILMHIKAKGGNMIMGDNHKVDVKETCRDYLANSYKSLDLEVFIFVKDNPQYFFPDMLDIWYSNKHKSYWEDEFRYLAKLAVETKQPIEQLEKIAGDFITNMGTAEPVIIMCEEKAVSPHMQADGLIMLIAKYCEPNELFEFMDKFNIDPNCRDGIIGLMIARFHPDDYKEFIERFNYIPSESKQRLISKTLKNPVVIKRKVEV